MAFVPLHVLKLVERGNALVLVHPPLSGLERILDGENTFYIQNARMLVHYPLSGLNTFYIDRRQSTYRKRSHPRSSLLLGLEHVVTQENNYIATHCITGQLHIVSQDNYTLYHRTTTHCITGQLHIVSQDNNALYHRTTTHCITGQQHIVTQEHNKLWQRRTSAVYRTRI